MPFGGFTGKKRFGYQLLSSQCRSVHQMEWLHPVNASLRPAHLCRNKQGLRSGNTQPCGSPEVSLCVPPPTPPPRVWHLPADTGYSWAEGRSVRWGAAAGCKEPGCSRHSSHSCRQVVVEVEVAGLCSPGCNLPGCRVAGCNSAGKWGEKNQDAVKQLSWDGGRAFVSSRPQRNFPGGGCLRAEEMGQLCDMVGQGREQGCVLDSTPSSKILGEQGTQHLLKFHCFSFPL